MRKSRFSEEQIIRVLGRVEAGALVRWKAKYGGMDVSEARRLKELEVENRRLKAAVAELTLDKQALKDVLSRKF
jgi:putative transposase